MIQSVDPLVRRFSPSRRGFGVLVALLILSLPVLFALQVGSGSGSTWEVFNSSGTSTGMVTSRASEGGGFGWTYYVWAPGETPPYTKAGSGTATETSPNNYTWQNANGSSTGTVTINSDGQSGSWTNDTSGHTGTIVRM